MSTIAISENDTSTANNIHLSFLRVLRSERMKFFSLRSSWITLAATALVCIAFNGLFALAMELADGFESTAIIAMINVEIGLMFMMSLAVLNITNEYSSGMIRSTLTAAPDRLTTISAKASLIGIVSLIWISVITLLSALLFKAILALRGVNLELAEIEVWRMFGGTSVAVTLLALIALGIGFILRSTAAGITSVFALIFVIPVCLSFAENIALVKLISEIMPSYGAQLIVALESSTSDILKGLAILVSWTAAALIAGFISLKRRDA